MKCQASQSQQRFNAAPAELSVPGFFISQVVNSRLWSSGQAQCLIVAIAESEGCHVLCTIPEDLMDHQRRQPAMEISQMLLPDTSVEREAALDKLENRDAWQKVASDSDVPSSDSGCNT